MTLLVISFIAGFLTVLAPCVLPLLPVIIGSSVGARSRFTPAIVIGSLALSIFLFTFILKASTALIAIPPVIWTSLSGGILALFGIILIFPSLWESLPLVAKSSQRANQTLGAGYQKKSIWGDVMIGAALGPVFSTCSPTYFVILATALPASFRLGTAYLLAYILGLVVILGLIALFGQRLTSRLVIAADSQSRLKRGLGYVFLLVGMIVILGLDKDLEAWLVEANLFDITRFEQQLLDEYIPNP